MQTYSAGVLAFLLSSGFGLFFFGMVWHELSHVIAAMIFGLPYRDLSLSGVLVLRSPVPYVNTAVGLAGGIGQALSSLVFLWGLIRFEKLILTERSASLLWHTLSFGYRLAFLTIAVEGFVVSIWEGFFPANYQQTVGNLAIAGTLFLTCTLIAFHLLYRKH